MTNRFVVLLVTSLILFSGGALFAEENDIAATVNGEPIYINAVERELNILGRQAYSQGMFLSGEQMEELRSRALDNLIDRLILFQDVLAKGYEIDEAGVDYYISALEMNYGGAENLDAELEMQGLSREKLRRDTGRYQVINTFVEETIVPEINISESESLEYYKANEEVFKKPESVRASHILVETSGDADEAEMKAALEKITELRKRIVNGEDFAKIAREYSDCPSSAKGGDLGEFGHGTMVPPFDKAVFALEVGEMSQPVQSQFGYHLIKLYEKHADEIIPYQDAEPQIMEYLGNLEVQSRILDYVAELRAAGEIIFN